MSITLVHPRDNTRVFEIEMSASAFDTCTVMRDTLVPDECRDEFRQDFLQRMEEEYEAMLYFHPTHITHTYWVTEFRKTFRLGNDVGKWMLFYPKSELDAMWQAFHSLFILEKLPGVVGMKCSTGKSNDRASDMTEGVIILYCNNSNDEPSILSIGRTILPHIGTYRGPYIYYKTDSQTGAGTRATGATRNHLYKLSTHVTPS
jgi:hypothetical protein